MAVSSPRSILVEWEFVRNLAYRSQLSDDEANFVKLIYITKLKKVRLVRGPGLNAGCARS